MIRRAGVILHAKDTEKLLKLFMRAAFSERVDWPVDVFVSAVLSNTRKHSHETL